ncbi:hypothetical protein NESM_000223300 [Novymonas esmeraldas]|uniref:Transmembrane protein n=1 Tax=Novymonas esmeraldas TaxID=1808958 RepID=A0AAW0F7C0_9TRYP
MCCDNPPHKRNWRLYHLLDLVAPTTARQVKWNFRKVTLRHHYYQAFLVLYNRSRKYLYDSIGEDAYGFISSGTWGPFVPLLGAVGSVLLYSLVLLVEVALLILFFAFLAAKDDALISWSWETVVVPLMVFVAIMVAVAIVAVVVNVLSPRTYQEGMAKMDRLSPVGNLFAAAAYFCIPFVIGSQIRNNPAGKVGHYLQYMCMPIIGDILYYATSLIWRWPRRLRLQMEVGNNRPSPVIYNGIFAMGFLNMACGIAQWVLIGYKLDGRLNRSWYIIFIPFCFRAGFRIAEACLRSLMKFTIGVRSEIGVAFDTVGSFFSNGILLISLYFVAVRIERGRAKVRLAYALIPVFLTLAWIFVCLVATMLLLLIFYCRRSREERRVNSQWTPPQDRDDDGARLLGNTDTSDSVPARVVKTSQRGWDEVDVATTSSAAFPEDVDAHNDEEYEDFDTDEEEEPIFPEETPRSSQQPYGSPRDDEGTYTDATPSSQRGSSGRYEVSRRTTTTTRRVYDVPARASHGASEREESGSARRRTSSRRHTPEVVSRATESAATGGDGYTDVTTYMDDYGTGSSSYTYSEETTYLDDEAGYTGSHTRSSSYSSDMSSSASVTSSAATGAERKQ